MYKLFLSLLFFLLLQSSYGQELYLFKDFEQDSIRSDRQLEGLMAALLAPSVSVKQAALERLAYTPWAGHVPPQYHAIISSQIDSTYQYLSIAAITTLAQQQLFNDSIDNHIAALLKDDDSDVRRETAYALKGQESLGEVYLQQLATLLKDDDSDVRSSAALALSGQESLSEVYLQQIAALLKDNDRSVRYFAALALRGQELLSDVVLQQIAALLIDDQLNVRNNAALALRGQESLSDVVLQQIAALLKNDKPGVRSSAAQALRGQKSLSEVYLQRIAALLTDDDRYVRSYAALALSGQESLSEVYLQQLTALLTDDESDVRNNVTLALRDRESLSDVVLQQIAALLKNEDRAVRSCAAHALMGQESLSEVYLQQIAALLKDDEPVVRSSAAQALSRQKSVSEVILQQITLLLKDNNSNVRSSAVKALRGQESMSEVVLQQIAALLENNVSEVRSSAVQALWGQKSLSEVVLQQIAALLKNDKPDVRSSAALALSRQESLGEVVLQEIAPLLKDDHSKVRSSAALALRCQEPLSEVVLQQIVALLKDDYPEVHSNATQALTCQESLSEVVLQQIAALLKDDDSDVRRSAFQCLYDQSVDAWYRAFPYMAENALTKENERLRDAPYQTRVPLYEISGNSDSITLLLNWFCNPAALPTKVSIGDARQVLDLTIGLEDLMPENPLFAAEVGQTLPELIRLAETRWSSADIDRLREGLLLIKPVNPTKAEYVQALIRSLETWRWIYTLLWVLAIHALLWLAIIILSPQFSSLQEIFIWNPTIRKWGGLGYIGFLITQIPLLRERLFHPHRQNLTAEAFPANWRKDEYFPSSQVYSLRDKKTLPVTEALDPFHGRIILEGESGLGKTMFLRNLVIDSRRPVAFLPASKCDQGLVPAIQQKVPPAEGDPAFLAELVYAGAVDILIDGLNEISARACAQLINEIESKCKGNVLLTTQPMEWEAPAAAKVFQLKPLTEAQIETYILSRYTYLDQSGLLPESAYQRNSKAYLEKAFDSELDKESLRTNFMTLSNPMELGLVAQLIARGQDPSILDLQEQQYQLMAEHYRRNNLGHNFPLARFSKVVYDMRLHDHPEIPTEDFQKEILALQHWKMVISRQWIPAGAEKPVKYWYFRHDKIMDFFLVQEFLADQILAEKHLDDARFRGVYFLLASKLHYADALKLREKIIQYAADTKDHSLSDNFIQLIRGRRQPRKQLLETIRQDILKTIALGETEAAIQLILNNTNGKNKQSAALLKSRESVLRKEILEGTISSEDTLLERNKINRGILDLAQIID